jgi:hypothetical protein
MVMATDTAGVTATAIAGMAGTPGIVITRITDITTTIPGIDTLLTGMYTPASVDPLTSSDRSMGQNGSPAEPDWFRTPPDPGRIFINDSKTWVEIQDHLVIQERGNVRSRTPINDMKAPAGMQYHPVIQEQGKT